MTLQPTKHPSHPDVLTLLSPTCNCGSNTYPRFTEKRPRRYCIVYNAMSLSVCGPKTVESLPFPSVQREETASRAVYFKSKVSCCQGACDPSACYLSFAPLTSVDVQNEFLRSLTISLRELRQLEVAKKQQAHVAAVTNEGSGSDYDEYPYSKRPSKRRKTST